MQGMFDSRTRDSEQFHEELMKNFDESKSKYDRQLFSDWILKVYQRCTNACLKIEVEDD